MALDLGHVQRLILVGEAIRLARQLRERLPSDGEVAGLLALMLLTDARRAARMGQDGAMVPLAAHDRMQWDCRAMAEGVTLIQWALTRTPVGPTSTAQESPAGRAAAAGAASPLEGGMHVSGTWKFKREGRQR